MNLPTLKTIKSKLKEAQKKAWKEAGVTGWSKEVGRWSNLTISAYTNNASQDAVYERTKEFPERLRKGDLIDTINYGKKEFGDPHVQGVTIRKSWYAKPAFEDRGWNPPVTDAAITVKTDGEIIIH